MIAKNVVCLDNFFEVEKKSKVSLLGPAREDGSEFFCPVSMALLHLILGTLQRAVCLPNQMGVREGAVASDPPPPISS